MSQAPLTYLERKWAASTGSNALIRGATQNNDRTQVQMLDYDTHRNVSNFGRRTLLTLGRSIFNNVGIVRNAVIEIARQCVSTYVPQYYGRNPAWGKLAEEWLTEGDKFIDVRRGIYNMAMFRRLFVEAIYRDGDVGIILATVDGQPRLQMIPSHRIGSRVLSGLNSMVEGGPYDGARIIDGCIVDDYGATMAWRIYGENTYDIGKYEDVSANDMMLCYLPDYCDQLRGFSLLGSVVFQILDVEDADNFELISQKIRASFSVQVKNETGKVDRSVNLIRGAVPGADGASGAAQALPQQLVQPGQISYFKAGKDQGMEVLDYDRPGQNVMAFRKEKIRAYLSGIGASYDYTHEPSVNGGALRIAVSKLNNAAKDMRSLVVDPAWQRITGWRISKGSNLKLIPDDIDWYKWNFQGPADETADEKYSSDVSINNIRAGITSPQDEIEKNGKYWERTQDQSVEYWARWDAKCKAAGVDPNRGIWPTPNGVPPEPVPTAQKDPNA